MSRRVRYTLRVEKSQCAILRAIRTHGRKEEEVTLAVKSISGLARLEATF